MIINLFKFFIRRYYLKKFRNIGRGYKNLKKIGRLDSIMIIKEILSKTRITNSRNFSSTIFGSGLSCAEITIRQSVLSRVAHIHLSQALLIASASSNKRVKAPLPKEWRNIVIENGYRVNELYCIILWNLYITLNLFLGLKSIFSIIKDGVFKKHANYNIENINSIFFADLKSNNFPDRVDGKQSYDLISWYLQWEGRLPNLTIIEHNVPNISITSIDGVSLSYKNSFFVNLSTLPEVMRYLNWAIKAIIISLLSWVRGHWWHSMLLRDASEAAVVRFLDKKLLPAEYFFSNSRMMMRPLWTYEASSKGTKFIYYFYSTNCEAIRRIDGLVSPNFGYFPLSWPRYLVWDKNQAEFVRQNALNEGIIDIVGPIWFVDSKKEIPKHKAQSIAVFDVPPVRDIIYRSFIPPIEYLVPLVINNFLNDIIGIAKKNGLEILWKKKRSIGQREHRLYKRNSENIILEKNVIVIDSDISPYRVIEAADIVISLPFTSTAHIAHYHGKPSAYYDATRLLRKDDPAAHGILILSGKLELEKWIFSNFIDLKT